MPCLYCLLLQTFNEGQKYYPKELIENSKTSLLFLLPFKNSCQEISKFSKEMILLKILWPKALLSLSLSLEKASILCRIKEGYLIWVNILPHIPKFSRYTIGTRIENKLLDLLETSYIAYYIEKDKKVGKISECILILDTLKFLISIAWEGKIISNKHFEEISTKLNEVGKMFGGWKKSLEIELS